MGKLTIVTYNIENGIFIDQITETIKKLIDRGVDIFCFQEVRKLPNRPPCEDTIRKVMGKNWKYHFFLDPLDPINSLGLGICWNTKTVKIVKVDNLYLPKIKYTLLEKMVTTGGKPSQRGIITAVFAIGNLKLRVTNLHLDWQGGPNGRFKQITILKKQLTKIRFPEIICGDFNTIENKKLLGKSYSELHQSIGLDFSEAFNDGIYTQVDGIAVDPTYPVLCLRQKLLMLLKVKIKRRLDYVWYRGIKLVNSEIITATGSDHRPLLAKFELKST